LSDSSFLAEIFEAVPTPTFLVDEGNRVRLCNRAARRLVGRDADGISALLKRQGAFMHCVHAAEHPDGCGHAEACSECVVRRSVEKAMASPGVARQTANVELHRGSRVESLTVLVSASPVEVEGARLAVVTIEDVTELTRLRSLIPICSGCGRVRDEGDEWQRIEAYLKARLDVDFSHGLCEPCERRLYPRTP